MTDQRRSSLSLASGLSLTIVLTAVGFMVESERIRCILWWPTCLLYQWIGFHDPEGREGTPADPIIFIFCLIVGFFIAATIYSLLALIILGLITKDDK